MKSTGIVRVGGIALILGAVTFLAVFAFLAARFDYPDVLDGPASPWASFWFGIGKTSLAPDFLRSDEYP